MSIEAKLERLCLAIESLAQVVAAGAVRAIDNTGDYLPATPAGPETAVAPAAVAAPVSSAPTMTIEEVRAKLTPTIQNHGPAIVGEVIRAMGHEKLSDLAPATYADLLARVETAVAVKKGA